MLFFFLFLLFNKELIFLLFSFLFNFVFTFILVLLFNFLLMSFLNVCHYFLLELFGLFFQGTCWEQWNIFQSLWVEFYVTELLLPFQKLFFVFLIEIFFQTFHLFHYFSHLDLHNLLVLILNKELFPHILLIAFTTFSKFFLNLLKFSNLILINFFIGLLHMFNQSFQISFLLVQQFWITWMCFTSQLMELVQLQFVIRVVVVYLWALANLLLSHTVDLL